MQIDRRKHPRRQVDATVLLIEERSRTGGRLADISRGGFLLSPHDELAVSEGGRAILQLGHRKLECEILGHSSWGVHCRFNGALDLDEFERLMTVARPAESLPELSGLLDSGALAGSGLGRFDPRALAKELLAQLAGAGRADRAVLIRVDKGGEGDDVLACFPEASGAFRCPCDDALPRAGDDAAVATTAGDGHFLCVRRTAGAAVLSVVLRRSLAAPPFAGEDLHRVTERAGDLWGVVLACHDLIREAQRIQVLYGLFENLSVPLFVVDASLRVHDINHAGAELLRRKDGIALKAGKLVCATAADSTQLRRMLAAPADGHANPAPIARKNSPHPYLATVVPAPRSLGERTLFALAIRDLGTGRPAAAEIDGKAFGLTKAEGRLAQLLVSGHSLLSAAATLGVSVNTARTHLKHIYEKTATSRQAQLVQLLTRSAPNL